MKSILPKRFSLRKLTNDLNIYFIKNGIDKDSQIAFISCGALTLRHDLSLTQETPKSLPRTH